MAYLLDTHVCLWAIGEDHKLSQKARDLIVSLETDLFVSYMSLFEIAIKLKIGKLPDFDVSLPEFQESIVKIGFEVLPLQSKHLQAYVEFKFSSDHRDPFDRYLIAVAYSEKMTIITKDEKFFRYGHSLDVIW